MNIDSHSLAGSARAGVVFPMFREDGRRPDEIRLPDANQPFVEGIIETAVGAVPRVSGQLTARDRWGSWKARWGVGRMDYKVAPGLYALGMPQAESPVFVTANYKMSFDRLRASLKGLSGWLLVLDTKGINVWCAAGKGTFGTKELLRQIEASGLRQLVTHRRLIVPQLGAPGVAAHMVKKLSGFTVQYGPVKAGDLPAFLEGGFRATPEMRRKTFPLRERAALIPIEFIGALKPSLFIVPLLYLSAGIGGPAGFWNNAATFGPFAVFMYLSALLAGTVLNPLLLPYLPGRAFSVKGFVLGIVVAAGAYAVFGFGLSRWPERLAFTAWLLIVPAVTAYLAMNFTGCSTYTSLSGVKKEMRWALPLQITMAAAGLVLWIAARLI